MPRKPASGGRSLGGLSQEFERLGPVAVRGLEVPEHPGDTVGQQDVFAEAPSHIDPRPLEPALPRVPSRLQRVRSVAVDELEREPERRQIEQVGRV